MTLGATDASWGVSRDGRRPPSESRVASRRGAESAAAVTGKTTALCLASLAPAAVFGVSSSTLALSSQSSSGPAGGASDGYGLGRGAAGPDRRCTTTAAGALRVIV